MKTVIAAAALLLVVAGSATAAQARANFNVNIDLPEAVAFMPPQVVIASSNFRDHAYRPYRSDRERYRGSWYRSSGGPGVECRDDRRDSHRGYARNERRYDHRGAMGERD